MRSLIVSVLCVFSLVFAQDTSLAKVKMAFDAANLPTDEHLIFDPTALFEVTFPETNLGAGTPPVHLHAAIHLNRNQTAIPPSFSLSLPFSPSLVEKTFVIAAVDPDAPTPQDPTNAQIRHFLGGDFRLSLFGSGLVFKNSTPAVTEFHQPTPPAGSDPHRYTFLLFTQPPSIRTFNTEVAHLVNSSTSISNFNISQCVRGGGRAREPAWRDVHARRA
ncbi:PEBP-like protein [Schizopora paradoxa]|uniref:PEBP-like protein n=1 Tax=Schizopora paradoxa TaxID=27342 RepID=A0A0H2S000_9AGAM|nr:PEBP-like protein [Schizopora paradoxa]